MPNRNNNRNPLGKETFVVNLLKDFSSGIMDFSENEDSLSQPLFQNYTHSRHEIVKAVFVKQPPPNLRKSNIFDFILRFYDENNNAIEIVEGLFGGFPEEDDSLKRCRNGLLYHLQLNFGNGHCEEHGLLVKLIDSQTGEIVCYEGQNKNPEMCRVLLTHEMVCSRCCEKKSCGNRNETPSDCVINEKYFARFFIKCNQNCLLSPGNPRDVRHFQIAITTTSNANQHIALSTEIFVHNNSKHGRRPTRKVQLTEYASPVIKYLIPKEGLTFGGTQVVIIGDNFVDGLQVIFGNCLVSSIQVFSQTALRVVAPPHSAGVVDVLLAINSRPIYKASSGAFLYTSVSEPSIEDGFHRLRKLIPKTIADAEILPKEILLKRAADLIESLYSPHAPQVVTPTLHHFMQPVRSMSSLPVDCSLLPSIFHPYSGGIFDEQEREMKPNILMNDMCENSAHPCVYNSDMGNDGDAENQRQVKLDAEEEINPSDSHSYPDSADRLLYSSSSRLQNAVGYSVGTTGNMYGYPIMNHFTGPSDIPEIQAIESQNYSNYSEIDH